MYVLKGNFCTHIVEVDEVNTKDVQIQILEEPLQSLSVHSALMNEVILQHLFDILQVHELKHCRLVCEKWRSVAEVTFKRRVRIFFDFVKVEDSEDDISGFLPPQNLNDFFRSTNEIQPFLSLRLSGPLPWSASELLDFFTAEGMFLTDLAMEHVGIRKENEELGNVLENASLESVIGPLLRNLKSLTIFSDSNDEAVLDTHFSLSLQNLLSIKCIQLSDCSLDLTESVILCPQSLSLSDILFQKNNSLLSENILLNEFVNFQSMRELYLYTNKTHAPSSAKIDLDFRTENNFKKLRLLGGSSGNYFNLNRKFGFPFPENCRINIQEISFGTLQYDIEYFPQSVKKLRIGPFILISEWNLSLPRIKCFHLFSYQVINFFLPFLNDNFTGLEELTLECYTRDWNKIPLDLNLIPKSVRKLTLIHGTFDISGKGIFFLENLTLVQYTLQSVVKISEHFAPRNLIIKYCSGISKNNTPMEMVSLLKDLFNTEIARITLINHVWSHFKDLRNTFLFQGNLSRQMIAKINGHHVFPVTPEYFHNITKMCSRTSDDFIYEFILPNESGLEQIIVNGVNFKF